MVHLSPHLLKRGCSHTPSMLTVHVTGSVRLYWTWDLPNTACESNKGAPNTTTSHWYQPLVPTIKSEDGCSGRPVKSHALRVWHTQLAHFTRSRANQDYSHACIFVHAWNRDMASSFTSIRDRRIKMPRVLGHYLLYNGSSTARWGPTSVMVHELFNIPGTKLRLIASFPEQGTKFNTGNEV